MANLTNEDIKRMVDDARDELNEKYGLEDENKYFNEDKKKKSTQNKKKNRRRAVVRNNHQRIGEVDIFLTNVKKAMIVSGIAGLAIVSFAAGRISKETKNVSYAYNVLSENYFKEPTYNGIKYTVKSGENIWSIVKKYESDESRVASLVSDILRLNKLEGKILQSGDEIELVGVPSSKLNEFGYTDNYNLLDPIVEVEVRIDFLNKVKENLSVVPNASSYLERIDEVLDSWNNYKYSYVSSSDDEFNLILTELREVCEEAKDYGYDYDFNKKAYPLDVVNDYENEENRTY